MKIDAASARNERTASRRRVGNRFSPEWSIPLGLILLSLVPALAGTARLAELASGAAVTPANARFFAVPLPVVVHIVGSIVYALVGAFQFVPHFRLRYPRWHRTAGWLITPFGLVVALSGLWMAHFYPWPEGDGVLLYWLRLAFGTMMALSLLLGILSMRQRKYARHGAWMIRAYAVGLGAGTQVFTHMAWALMTGRPPDEFSRAMLMGAGWVINLVVAEWVIRQRLVRPRRQ